MTLYIPPQPAIWLPERPAIVQSASKEILALQREEIVKLGRKGAVIPIGMFRHKDKIGTPITITSAVTKKTTSSTSWTINLPSGIAAGDTLFIYLRASVTFTTFTITGFTALVTSTHSTWPMYKLNCTGSEGSTVTGTSGSSANGIVVALLLHTVSTTQAPTIDNTVSGASGTTIDPHSVTASWGSFNNLFISTGSAALVSQTITSYSARYNTFKYFDTEGGGGNLFVAICCRQLIAATDDPGPITFGSTYTTGGGTGYSFVFKGI